MAYFYSLTDRNPVGSSSGLRLTVTNAYAFPYTDSSGATHDETSLNETITIYGSSSYPTRGSIYVNGNPGYVNYYYTESSKTYKAFKNYYNNCLLKTNTQISSTHLTLLSSAKIGGRYRITASTLPNCSEYLGYGTVPVSFTINDVAYKYMAFPAATYWGYSYTSSRQWLDNNSPYGVAMYYTPSVNYSQPTDWTLLTTAYNSNTIATAFQGGIIDFGDVAQEVPQVFVDWIESFCVPIYPYTYTIKSSDGETQLAELTEAPAMSAVEISATATTVAMILTGVNSKTYTVSWHHTVPEGQQFLGLAYSTAEKRASLPTGTKTSVSWESDITVYEIYGKYVPPATTFTLTLYQSSAEITRVDKTNYLTSVGTLSGALRAECSIINPSIVIAQETLPVFNYVYIPIFNRYYFVVGVTSVNYGLWRVEMNCDVLMSYKDGVKALTAVIGRQENSYNDYLIDTELPTEKEGHVDITEISNDVLTNQSGSTDHTFVLTVIGA